MTKAKLSFTVSLILIFISVFSITAEQSSDSEKVNFSVGYDLVELPINDFVYDSERKSIWASIPNIDESGQYGNTVVQIDLETGAILSDIWAGSDPNKLAISNDNSTLYIGLDGIGGIKVIDLASKATIRQFGLGSGHCGLFQAYDMVVVNGDPNSVAVSISTTNCNPGFEGVAIYTDGVMRPNSTTVGINMSNNIEPSEIPNKLYGYNSLSTAYDVTEFTIDDDGIYESSISSVHSGFNITYDSGLLYFDNREVYDPINKTLIGQYGEGNYGASPIQVAINSSADQIYYFEKKYFPERIVFEIFETGNFEPIVQREYSSFKDELVVEARYADDGKTILLTKTDLHQPNAFKMYLFTVTPLHQHVYLPIVRKGCVFTDDFSNKSSGWRVENTPNVTYSYINNEYSIVHKQGNQWTSVDIGHEWGNSQSFEAEGRIVKGNGYWGLLYGSGNNWLYSFEISPAHGTYTLSSYNTYTGWSVDNYGWFNSTGTYANNKLSIVQNNYGNFEFRINDNWVYEGYLDQGVIGLTAGSFVADTEVRFDNYTLVEGNCR